MTMMDYLFNLVCNIGSGGFSQYISYSTTGCHFLSLKMNMNKIIIGVILVSMSVILILQLINSFNDEGE